MWNATGNASRGFSGAARPDTPCRDIEDVATVDVTFAAWGDLTARVRSFRHRKLTSVLGVR